MARLAAPALDCNGPQVPKLGTPFTPPSCDHKRSPDSPVPSPFARKARKRITGAFICRVRKRHEIQALSSEITSSGTGRPHNRGSSLQQGQTQEQELGLPWFRLPLHRSRQFYWRQRPRAAVTITGSQQNGRVGGSLPQPAQLCPKQVLRVLGQSCSTACPQGPNCPLLCSAAHQRPHSASSGPWHG